MQDKDFDRFIQQAFENQPEPEYNPADWDQLEDRLHNLNTAQPSPSAGTSAGAGAAKLGFVASAVLVTAFNVAFFAKPELFKNAILSEEKTAVVAASAEQTEMPETSAIASDNTRTQTAAITAAENQISAAAPTTLNSPVMETLPEVKTAQTENAVAVVKPAAASNNKKRTLSATAKNNQPASNTMAWPTVAANRSNFPANNNGMQAGKPQATILPCNPTFKPEIATILIGEDTLRGSRLALTTCEPLEARIFTQAAAGKVTVTSNVSSVLAGARFIIEENSNTALLQWQPTPAMARQEPYIFTLWLADANCTDATPQAYQFAVQVNPAFTAALNGTTRISKGQETILEVKGAPQGSVYQWVTGNKILEENETGRLIATPAAATTYRVLATAPNGCVFTDSLRVEVVPGNMLNTAKIIPNIFTPNNDGLNDNFEVKLPEEGAFSLHVFDRDGTLVFAQQEYDNKWNGGKQPSGTYYYIITTARGNKTYKGWVEIMR